MDLHQENFHQQLRILIVYRNKFQSGFSQFQLIVIDVHPQYFSPFQI